MKAITFNKLNKHNMIGAKFTVKGSETIYVFNSCQLPRNGQFTALNEKFNTTSKIGLQAKLYLV